MFISSKDKTDLDIIRSEHRFLWNEDDDDSEETWYENEREFLKISLLLLIKGKSVWQRNITINYLKNIVYVI